MSATDQMRMMINQLMGTDPQDEDSRDRIHFTDPRMCRSFLIGCCPHEILASTRMDLGDCQKIHDVALRADFEKARQAGKDYFYDLDGLDHLERFFDDCDRKTEIAKKRLEDTQEEMSVEIQEKADKVLELNEDIGKTLAEAERLGIEGKVDESLKLMEKVEELRKTKSDADQEYRGSMPASSYQQQKLRVCEVCSAYLGIHDNDRRLADHFGGKLHMGFVFLRERLAELRATAEERRTERRTKGRDRSPEYSRSRHDRDRRSRDDRRRRRSRSRSRDRGDRRSRSVRSRDKDSRGSRERDSRRSRDRDRNRDSERDRERSKKRKRERRSRSTSKSRSRERSTTKRESLESGERASNGKSETRLSDVDD